MLLSRLGVDITDPGFWRGGLEVLDELVTEAESLAKSTKLGEDHARS